MSGFTRAPAARGNSYSCNSIIESKKINKEMKKRARKVVTPTHCNTCGERMDQLACCVDWHAVYVSRAVKDFMIENGRIPTGDELKKMDESIGSDMCDDCCCGACGCRKRAPGDVCC
jgi:hypothetical protein